MGNVMTGNDSYGEDTRNIIQAFQGAQMASARQKEVDAQIQKMNIDADLTRTETKVKALNAQTQFLQTATLAGMKPNIDWDKFQASGGTDLLGAITSIQTGDPLKAAVAKINAGKTADAETARAQNQTDLINLQHKNKMAEIDEAAGSRAGQQTAKDKAALVRATLMAGVKAAQYGTTEDEAASANRAVGFMGGVTTPQSSAPGAPGQPGIPIPGVFGSNIFGRVITPDDVIGAGLNNDEANLFVSAAHHIQNNPAAKTAIIQKLQDLVPKTKSLLNQ